MTVTRPHPDAPAAYEEAKRRTARREEALASGTATQAQADADARMWTGIIEWAERSDRWDLHALPAKGATATAIRAAAAALAKSPQEDHTAALSRLARRMAECELGNLRNPEFFPAALAALATVKD